MTNTQTQQGGPPAAKAPVNTKLVADRRMSYLKPVGDEKSVANLFAEKWVIERIQSVLPKHLTADRLAKIAVQSILKTPALLKCTKMSLVQAVMQLSELGLEPSGALGLAHIVPFKGTASPMIGWRGYVELARRSGIVKDVRARLVYEKDRVEHWEGLDEHFRVYPSRLPPSQRGKITDTYSVAEFTNGGKHLELMALEEVEAIRAKTREAKGGQESAAWTDPQSYPEMVRKTVVRRGQKFWPLSSEYKEVIEKAEKADIDVIEGEFRKDSPPQVQVPAETPDSFFTPSSSDAPGQSIEDADVVTAGPEEGAPTEVPATDSAGQAETSLDDAPPPVTGPDELAEAIIAEMKGATDLKSLAAAGAKAKGLPPDLERRVMEAFVARKAELDEKKGKK